MAEVLKYISIDFYNKEVKTLKNGQTKIIYEDTNKRIKLMKRGRKVYNIIVNYGNIPIDEIAKNLLIQA